MSLRTAAPAMLLAGLLLSGCGNEQRTAPHDADAAAAEDPPVKLTFWHIMNYSGPKEILEQAVRAFEKANPGTDVVIQTFENDAYKTKLAVEMASGTPPDILFTWGGGPLAEFAAAGRVVDLTDALQVDGWGERFIDQAVDICRADGRVYAVPLDLSAVVLWYNRALFAEADRGPPATFEDLLSLCRTFHERKITPMALGNMKQWPGAFYFIYLANRRGGTQLFLDAAAGMPGARFDDPAFVQAGGLLERLLEAKAFPVGFNGIDVGQARSRFLTGKAAMYLMGTWMVARAQTEQPDFLETLSCAPFPAVEGGRGEASSIVGGVNCGFAVSADCAHPDKAVELLRYLTAPDVAEAWCGIGRIPALKVSEQAEKQLPAPTREALALLKSASSLQPYYDQYLSPRLAAEHKKTTQNLFARTMTPEQAAGRMAECARETLGD